MAEHISPVKTYVSVFLFLMAATVITVVIAFQHLGVLNALVALSIASVKATMVILYFMHVKYSSRLTKLVVVAGFFFLLVLLVLTMADYGSREWLTVPPTLQ